MNVAVFIGVLVGVGVFVATGEFVGDVEGVYVDVGDGDVITGVVVLDAVLVGV